MTSSAETERVAQARRRHEQATREHRLALIAAADDLRARARSRSRLFRRAMLVVVALACVLAVIAGALAIADRRAQERVTLDAGVLDAAQRAVTVMLTSDPARATTYVDTVIALSTGAQRDRLEAARDELSDVVAQQGVGSAHVVGSGLITDPPDDAAGARAQALVVVQADNPALIGADPTAQRITVRLTMVRVGDQWLVERADNS